MPVGGSGVLHFTILPRRSNKEVIMKVSDFAVRVAREEGKKKQVSIAQILEILKIVNKLTQGALYKWIRAL